MTDQSEIAVTDRGSNRRGLLKNAGLGLAGTAVLAAAGVAGLGLGTTSARADAATDQAVFNFALNLEYLEAEYYLRAVTGNGIPVGNATGGGAQVSGGSLVPFQNTAIAYLAQKIAVDELAHVTFIRSVLGAAAVNEPTIDLSDSFTTLAIAAGLITQGQTFNPFSSETNFLIGAYIFEDVGVTAYAGAAALLTPATLPYAASVLAVEAYHAGAIRQRLAEIGGSAATDQISALRQKLSGVGDNGLNYQNNMFNVTNVDSQGQAYRRTAQQVLSIVYGGGTTSGLFFPNGVNGAINSSASS
jgi:hypothetical protein